MDDIKYSTIGKLCVTRRTVRATCFQKIIENFPLLLALWEECLKEKLDPETRSRIIGIRAQMKVFNFYFGLCLSQKLYALTDNLSKSIQKEIMPVTGQRTAALALKTVERMRNETDFNLLFQTLRKKVSDLDLEDATFPRKRKTPNYSRLHHLDDHRDQADAFYPSSIEEHFRVIY